MTKQRTIVIDVDHVERAGTSYNGNPHYWIMSTDGARYRTGTDSACGYGVTNMVGRASRTGQRGITLVLEGKADGGVGRVVDFYKVIDGKQVRP